MVTLDGSDLRIYFLGQTGFRFEHADQVMYIDPYLSNSVQDNEGEDLARLRPVPVDPSNIRDADWVLVTHEHRDHCDVDSLLPISNSSVNCRFVGPPNVVNILNNAGIKKRRIEIAKPDVTIKISEDIEIYPVPSAHPEIEYDSDGMYRWLGYVIKFGGVYIYHAGDTSVNDVVISELERFKNIDMALIPVNERNYYRERRGIIGNMSIREAFKFAEDIGANKVFPTHWDMFEQNSVFQKEIELMYELLSPEFELLMDSEVA